MTLLEILEFQWHYGEASFELPLLKKIHHWDLCDIFFSPLLIRRYYLYIIHDDRNVIVRQVIHDNWTISTAQQQHQFALLSTCFWVSAKTALIDVWCPYAVSPGVIWFLQPHIRMQCITLTLTIFFRFAGVVAPNKPCQLRTAKKTVLADTLFADCIFFSTS